MARGYNLKNSDGGHGYALLRMLRPETTTDKGCCATFMARPSCVEVVVAGGVALEHSSASNLLP